MNDLREFNESISQNELFSFLYDRVITRDISTFSQLRIYAEPVIKDKRTHSVLARLFELIKKLNWGFFSPITPDTHKKLWRELVISDPQFPNAGDLKRTLSISNLYIGMLDIHGYTQFCQDTRKNLSMMHTLDRSINNEVRDICTHCHAVSQRERGDEIVMIAASATDAVTAVIAIFDYFGKTNVLNDPSLNVARTGDASILPAFKLSAGITGGNTSSPLIITEQGGLSGFLLNSGARLQVRANELSPKESRIMVTKQVYMNYLKENEQEKCVLEQNGTIYFFDTGIIEFKGVQLPTMEAVFKSEERYKEKISDDLAKLLNSIKSNLWEQRIYLDMVELLAKTAKLMPKFNIFLPEPILRITEIDNDAFARLCTAALKSFLAEDYSGAVDMLHQFITIIGTISSFDRLILDYLKGVVEKYNILLKAFNITLDKEIENKAADIFSDEHLRVWTAAQKALPIYERLKVMGRQSNKITGKKVLWHNLIQKHSEELEFKLYSGKK